MNRCSPGTGSASGVEVQLPVKAERATGESRVVPSVADYGLRATTVLIRAIRDYSPLRFSGRSRCWYSVPSILIGIAVFVHLVVQLARRRRIRRSSR